MSSVLQTLLQNTAVRIAEKKLQVSYETLERQVKPVQSGFYDAMLRPKTGDIAVITEIKLASPTHAYLGNSEDILIRAKQYREGGADAISIITEPSIFHGDIAFLPKVKTETGLPVIQKDFVIDPYQVVESAQVSADAVLLIAKITKQDDLVKFVDLSQSYGIEPVVEVNDTYDLEKALTTTTRFIAVNARDLSTLTVDVGKACELMEQIPDSFFRLGFSGILSRDEVNQYKAAGAIGVLIGTQIMKTENIGAFIAGLRS
jgi:indole-3-glycerol phosphate synthase